MTELKVPIPENLADIMKKHPEIKWDGIASEAIQNYIKGLESNLYAKKYKQLEHNLKEIEKKIENYQDNWLEEGSVGFNRSTWNNVTSLVKKILEEFWKENIEIPIPTILLNGDGSFDVDWQTEKFELLLVVPYNKDDLVHFFGEKSDFPEDEIEVRINYELVKELVVKWIKKIL